ncbi:uncharacterized protein LOC124363505 [Homalodisca vitripennis]|uniref:uncharacterized protein LOC124363505 n=1 Tax=Homalodisca vitripennis TaxID=197043 RepID=UPI001EEBE5EE|nr:uncharacterized protein LOC124363505 [Homalodisca vitripennis]
MRGTQSCGSRTTSCTSTKLKNDAWEAIATQLETTYDTVKSKITSLLASFRREKNKEETSKGTGKGADEIYRSKWFAYEAFGFLKDKNKCKETINSCTSQNASKENDSQVSSRITLFYLHGLLEIHFYVLKLEMPPNRFRYNMPPR